MRIDDINLKIIKDSANLPAIEASINNFTASYPGGTSKGKYEQKELNPRPAIKRFNRIKHLFIGDFDQYSFDTLLLKHINKIGINLTTPLSLTFFSANYKQRNTFPNLLGNVFGGGTHSKNSINIQEILVTPKKDFPSAVRSLRRIWKEVGCSIEVKKELNLESAWSAIMTNEKALELVCSIAKKYNAKVGIDLAGSQLYRNGRYIWNNKKMERKRYINNIQDMASSYSLYYIEDPVMEKDVKGYRKLKNSTKSMICGDDLIVTDMTRVKKLHNAIDAVIVKPNQAGTVTGCMNVIEYCKKHDITPIVSHRSKTTRNTALAKLAMHTPLAKIGIAGYARYKLNEMIRMWKSCKNPRMARI